VDQTVPSRRALIVDDEFLIAFDLESSMRVGLRRLHCGVK
jgi:hypothetical protein